MSAKIIPLSEVNTKDLFDMKQFMLGDKTGNWFVVDDGLYLGRYEDLYRAQEHVDALADSKKSSPEALKRALEFADNIGDQNE